MNLTSEQLEQGNKAIMNFMGVSIEDKSNRLGAWFVGTCWHPNRPNNTWSCASSNKKDVERLIYQLKYFHSDWNWLMPVYEKISSLYIKNFPINTYIGNTGVYIGINPTNASGENFKGQPKIADTLNINHFELETGIHYTLIESVWLGIVSFLNLQNN